MKAEVWQCFGISGCLMGNKESSLVGLKPPSCISFWLCLILATIGIVPVSIVLATALST